MQKAINSNNYSTESTVQGGGAGGLPKSQFFWDLTKAQNH
jgi:hypothetical protein